MSELFVRIGIEIPLSLYANLDKIKNGSAASNRILEAVKKEKNDMPTVMGKANFDYCPNCGAKMEAGNENR